MLRIYIIHVKRLFYIFFTSPFALSMHLCPAKIALCLSEGAMKAKLSGWGQMPTALVKVSQRKAIKKGLVALSFLLLRPIDFAEKLSILPTKVPRCYTGIIQSYYTWVVIESWWWRKGDFVIYSARQRIWRWTENCCSLAWTKPRIILKLLHVHSHIEWHVKEIINYHCDEIIT